MATRTRFLATLAGLAAAAALIGLGNLANAQPGGSFEAYDRDGNGVINKQEFEQRRAQRGAGPGMGQRGTNRPQFSRIDTNRDGTLSESEWNHYHSERMQHRGAEGRMLRHAGQGASFKDLDANRDGKVDPAEFSAYQSQRMRRGMP